MVNIFIVLLVTVLAERAPASESCSMPVDANPGALRDCSTFHWSADDLGGLTVRDQGEALWADAEGVLHVAKSTSDLPEPYRSMYQSLRKQPNGVFRVVDQVPAMRPVMPDADAHSPLATNEALRRQGFRNAITAWRQELYDSTRMLLETVLHPPSDGANPLAFAYVPSRKAYGADQPDATAAAVQRVLRARNVLLNELPAQAKEQGAPPAWLQ